MWTGVSQIRVQVGNVICCIHRQKAAWFEIDFCVSIASCIATLRVDHFYLRNLAEILLMWPDFNWAVLGYVNTSVLNSVSQDSQRARFCFAQSRSSEWIIFLIIHFKYKVFTYSLNSHFVCSYCRLFGCWMLWWIIHVYLVLDKFDS